MQHINAERDFKKGQNAALLLDILKKYYKKQHIALFLITCFNTSAASSYERTQQKINHLQIVHALLSADYDHMLLQEIQKNSQLVISEWIPQWVPQLVCKGLNLEDFALLQNYALTFGSYRSSVALPTYISKISKLPSDEKDLMLNVLRHYVSMVLSGTPQKIRERSWDLPHLKKILSARPDLKETWDQEESWKLSKFEMIQEKLPDQTNLSIDLGSFFVQKILRDKRWNLKSQHEATTQFSQIWLYLNSIAQDAVRRKGEYQKIKTELGAKIKSLKKQRGAGLRNPNQEMPEQNAVETNLKQVLKENQLLRLIKKCVESTQADRQLKALRQLYEQIKSIAEAQEFIFDLKQMLNILKKVKSTTDHMKDWQVAHTDHHWDLFLCGSDVFSCQSVESPPSYSKCLMGYVTDAKNRLLAVKDPIGRTQSRAILRLLWNETVQQPTLFLEKVYSNACAQGHAKVLKALALQTAKRLDLPLFEGSHTGACFEPLALKSLGSSTPWEYCDGVEGTDDTKIFAEGIYMITKGNRLA